MLIMIGLNALKLPVYFFHVVMCRSIGISKYWFISKVLVSIYSYRYQQSKRYLYIGNSIEHFIQIFQLRYFKIIITNNL